MGELLLRNIKMKWKQVNLGRIIRVLCPHCRKNYMNKTNRYGGSDKWECLDCVFLYTDQWFNEFHQFEDCVTRE